MNFKQGFAGELKQKRKKNDGFLWASAPSVMKENKKMLVWTVANSALNFDAG